MHHRYVLVKIWIEVCVSIYIWYLFYGGNIGENCSHSLERTQRRSARKTVSTNHKNSKVIGCEKHELKTAKARRKKNSCITPQFKETTQEKICARSVIENSHSQTCCCFQQTPISMMHLRQSHFLEAHLNSNRKCLHLQGAISMAGIVIYRPGATNVGTPADV